MGTYGQSELMAFEYVNVFASLSPREEVDSLTKWKASKAVRLIHLIYDVIS